MALSNHHSSKVATCLQVFSQKAGSVRKALKAKAELIFVTAPHAIALTDTDPTFAKAASAGEGMIAVN